MCLKNAGLALFIIMIAGLLLAGCAPEGEESGQIKFIEPHVTNKLCTQAEDCPKGFECALLPGKTESLCVEEGVCDWACGLDEKCSLMQRKVVYVSCISSKSVKQDNLKGSYNLSREASEEPAINNASSGSLGNESESAQIDEAGNAHADNTYIVHAGESVKIAGHKFTVVSVSNNPLYVLFNVDARKGHIVETKYWEVLEGLRIKLISFEMHGYKSPDTFGVFEIEPLKLEEEQYFIEKTNPAKVLGATIKLEDVNSDGRAYISIPEKDVFWESFKRGESRIIDGLKIRLVESFYKTRDYAIFEITSVSS